MKTVVMSKKEKKILVKFSYLNPNDSCNLRAAAALCLYYKPKQNERNNKPNRQFFHHCNTKHSKGRKNGKSIIFHVLFHLKIGNN